MKKLYCLLIAVTFILIGIAPVHAQLKSSSQSALARKVLAEQKYYMFDRVKTMCQEWPGCEKWALKRHKENPSFTIIDAEIEYYVTNQPPKDSWLVPPSSWHYNLYVETVENLQTQTYVFVAKDDTLQEDILRENPSKFKKFPGHPFTDMPSEHAKHEVELWKQKTTNGTFPLNSNMRKRWPSVMDNFWELTDTTHEQQRVIWDKNDNPRWERRLDFILVFPWTSGGKLKGTIIAHQQKPGSPFEFTADGSHSILKEAVSRPKFIFKKVYTY